MLRDRTSVHRRPTGLPAARPVGRRTSMVAAFGTMLLAAVLAVPAAAVADQSVNATATPFKGIASGDCATVSYPKAAWHYNWWLSPGSCTAPGYVPMISGKGNHGPGDISWGLDQIQKAGYDTVLGFNEPNKASQSNLSVAEAVSLWPTLTSRPGLRVTSPATSSDGKTWFEAFMAEVQAKKLRVDIIAIHWYGWSPNSCDDANAFKRYLEWAESFPGNRPIWITEIGCMNESNPTRAKVEGFYASLQALLASHPRVQRYAWYPHLKNNELVEPEPDHPLTPLGRAFDSAPSQR